MPHVPDSHAQPFRRRFVAAVVALAMILTSLGTLARGPAADPLHRDRAQAAAITASFIVKTSFGADGKGLATPCRKAVLPGGSSSCSIFAGLAAVPVAATADLTPQPDVRTLRWGLAKAHLAAQCSGPSLDRPPCPAIV
jgi:hypothetical protein